MAEVYRISKLENSVQIDRTDLLVAVKLHIGELINYRFIHPVRACRTAEAGKQNVYADQSRGSIVFTGEPS